jgi:Leucine-rich repeat (LRR) protein
MEKMKNLEHLDLSSNRITDDAIEHIAKIGANLKYLGLKGTGITSQALCVLAGTVPNLTSLSLSHTKIDDSALAYISMMPLLRTVDLSHTSIKGLLLLAKYLFSLSTQCAFCYEELNFILCQVLHMLK